jgi:multicomponent Na+:H+ antiporter subunit D
MWFFVPVLLVSSALMVVYFWRIIELAYFPKDTGADPYALVGVKREEAPMGMVIPTFIMAGLCIFFGVYTTQPVAIVFKAAEILLKG